MSDERVDQAGTQSGVEQGTTDPHAAEAPTEAPSPEAGEGGEPAATEAESAEPAPETPDPAASESRMPEAGPEQEAAGEGTPEQRTAAGDDDGPASRLDTAQLKAIVEALVFASPEPLTPKMLLKLLNDEPKEDVLAAIEALKQEYETRGGLHLVEVAGGYQITTRPELHEWVRRLFHERTTQKLSVQALETLAVIAYKQPITAAEIGEIRGVNTSGVLSTLMERHLIKIVGRKNVIGRPFLYGTTKEFLIRFGLKDLNDLPKIEDMAQALGFDAPAILMEQPVTEEMLPLEEDQPEDDRDEHEPAGDASHADAAADSGEGAEGAGRAADDAGDRGGAN